MDEESLIPFLNSPRRRNNVPSPSSLCVLPENDEAVLPPLRPPSLKELLIFGPAVLNSEESAEDESSSSSNTITIPPSSSCSIPPPPPLPPPPAPLSRFSRPTHYRQQQQQQQQQQNQHQHQHQHQQQHHPRSNLHRSRTAPAISVIGNASDPHAAAIQMPQSSVVRQAVILLIIYLALGVLVFFFNRHHFSGEDTNPLIDALYFCVVTMCTIGYGDITPSSPSAKIFSIMFVLVGFGFVDILLSGMVNYVLDLQESLLLSSAIKGEAARNYIIDVKKGRMRIRMKIGLALGVVILCIGVGIVFLRCVEKLGWLDSFYLSVMSVTTVGYGDQAFKTLPGRIFASVWLLVSTLAVARAFLYLTEWRIDRRHRRIAKWVLHRDMTVLDLIAADIDNNGFVSKSEFVIYKLKEMGKIGEKDILQICNQFNRLDTGKCGKITLSDLMESRH
ncbi:two-pore potassium channel 3 [Nymphaea colorata]|nr:two-pore potassium channel 3 [Nymphaea colorata]